MIFVLDDMMLRIRWFQKIWGHDKVDYAHDPFSAAEKLRSNRYDMIFLDHDLGGPFTRGPEGDGITLARVMVAERIATGTPIIIHSANPSGAKGMYIELSKAYPKVSCIPFPTLRDKLNAERLEEEE